MTSNHKTKYIQSQDPYIEWKGDEQERELCNYEYNGHLLGWQFGWTVTKTLPSPRSHASNWPLERISHKYENVANCTYRGDICDKCNVVLAIMNFVKMILQHNVVGWRGNAARATNLKGRNKWKRLHYKDICTIGALRWRRSALIWCDNN